MKITHHTPDELIIRIPNMIFFIGSVFVAIGLIATVFTFIAPELPVIFPIMFLSFLVVLGSV